MPIKPANVSPEAFAIIVGLIQSTSHGTVTLIIQDARLLQIERIDKIRLDTLGRSNYTANRSTGESQKTGHGENLDQRRIERLRCRLAEELKDLAFGQIVLVIKDRLLVQIERTEKQRLTGVEGIYGDGI